MKKALEFLKKHWVGVVIGALDGVCIGLMAKASYDAIRCVEDLRRDGLIMHFPDGYKLTKIGVNNTEYAIEEESQE